MTEQSTTFANLNEDVIQCILLRCEPESLAKLCIVCTLLNGKITREKLLFVETELQYKTQVGIPGNKNVETVSVKLYKHWNLGQHFHWWKKTSSLIPSNEVNGISVEVTNTAIFTALPEKTYENRFYPDSLKLLFYDNQNMNDILMLEKTQSLGQNSPQQKISASTQPVISLAKINVEFRNSINSINSLCAIDRQPLSEPSVNELACSLENLGVCIVRKKQKKKKKSKIFGIFFYFFFRETVVVLKIFTRNVSFNI